MKLFAIYILANPHQPIHFKSDRIPYSTITMAACEPMISRSSFGQCLGRRSVFHRPWWRKRRERRERNPRPKTPSRRLRPSWLQRHPPNCHPRPRPSWLPRIPRPRPKSGKQRRRKVQNPKRRRKLRTKKALRRRTVALVFATSLISKKYQMPARRLCSARTSKRFLAAQFWELRGIGRNHSGKATPLLWALIYLYLCSSMITHCDWLRLPMDNWTRGFYAFPQQCVPQVSAKVGSMLGFGRFGFRSFRLVPKVSECSWWSFKVPRFHPRVPGADIQSHKVSTGSGRFWGSKAPANLKLQGGSFTLPFEPSRICRLMPKIARETRKNYETLTRKDETQTADEDGWRRMQAGRRSFEPRSKLPAIDFSIRWSLFLKKMNGFHKLRASSCTRKLRANPKTRR